MGLDFMLEVFDSVCILLAKAEQKHFQYTKKMLDERGVNITPGQMVVLYALYKGDGISITDLGKKVFLDNSTLTGLIDRLERAGLLIRTAVPEDRRSYNIHLTARANEIRDDVLAINRGVADFMLADCTDAEIAVFRRVLLNIYNRL
jgi:DNA-binding MarR family transcriptional regulator